MENQNEKAYKVKPKLLVTASTFPRWDGDTEPRFVLDLAKAMKHEYDITVLVPSAIGAKMREEMEGINVIRYRYFPIKKWETLCYPGAILPRIKEKKVRVLLVPFLIISLYFKLLIMLPKYDLVHSHWLIPQGIIQSFFKKPYIVTGHGGDVTSLNKGIMKKLKIRCLRKASHVTTVSDYLKQQVNKLLPLKQIDVISMGCNVENFSPENRVEQYFGQGEKKVVLFVGRLAEIKGVTYLIEAMKGIDALLVIVGDGPLRNSLMKQAEESEINVKFLSSKTHDELKIIYASADLFVAPSITGHHGNMEGLGLVILEAMASGLPVISNRSGGISELISDGINGFLCVEKNVEQLRDSIRKLINNGSSDLLEAEMKKTIQTYNYSSIGEKYINIMKRYGKVSCVINSVNPRIIP